MLQTHYLLYAVLYVYVQNGTDIWLTVGVDIDDDRLWVGSNAVVIGDEGNETLVRSTVQCTL